MATHSPVLPGEPCGQDGITNSKDMNSSRLWEIVEDRGAWHAAAHGVARSQTRLSD